MADGKWQMSDLRFGWMMSDVGCRIFGMVLNSILLVIKRGFWGFTYFIFFTESIVMKMVLAA